MRAKMLGTIAAAMLAATTTLAATATGADLVWGPAPAAFPKGAQAAVLAGDPGKAGVFIIRLRFPAGYRIPAHHHPTDENLTVIAGDMHLGMGDRIDTTKGLALGTGGFGVAPAGMNHYAWTTSGATVQVEAVGPFAMTYVNSADDPRR